MRFAPLTSLLRPALILACITLAAIFATSPAAALVVENTAGTTVAPADDPGWNYVTTGGRNMVYLGDGWVLSAFHVGAPTPSEVLSINGGSFNVVSNQAFMVKNQPGQGLSTETDLRMFRINGDPGLSPLNIASLPINEAGTNSFQINQREVTIIGNGPTRQANQTRWNVTTVSNGPDIWTESATGAYVGYKSEGANVKRWGTNQIADEDGLFGGNDNDLRGNLQLTLCGGACTLNVQSMVTQFDASGLTNEAQVVGGDSGSSVFFKRNGVWELIGIVNAQLSGLGVDGQSTANAVYGNYTTFADLSYYRSDILNIMNANANYSVLGDINLDGFVTGTTTAAGGATGDLAAFVAGWGYNNGTGVGTVTSWKKGDLNRDGKTDYLDFVLLRTAFNPTGGSGGLTLGSLFGGTAVPEPASLIAALGGIAFLAISRRFWRR
ncbi:MAG: hypothetical protein AB7G28_08525 [Pirellulales bacterium]